MVEIVKTFNTDKIQHGYLPHYEKHLDFEWESLLEIGVYKGESMRMWKESFPDKKLYGLDLFVMDPIPYVDGVQWFVGGQTDGNLLGQVRGHNIDVIIDDGSHNSRDQWMTFWALFRSCKLYVVEDLHCCKEPFYREGLEFNETMLGQMLLGKFPFRFDLRENIAFIYAD